MPRKTAAVEMTRQWVQNVPLPASGRKDYPDDKVSGLHLRVSASGHKSWVFLFRLKGEKKLRRLTIGGYPAFSLADARLQANKLHLEVGQGNNPADDKQTLRKAPTVADVAKAYIDEWAKVEKRTWKSDQYHFDKNILPAIGAKKLHAVTRQDILSLMASIKGRGAPIQANRALAVVRKMYNWSIDNGITESSPCHKVKANTENKRQEFLSDESLKAVWRAFESQSHSIELIFKLLLLTGQRTGEVERMRWCDVDFNKLEWTIPPQFTKNKKLHLVPLSEFAFFLLEKQRVASGDGVWVFPSPTVNGRHIDHVQHAKGRVQEASGVEFRLHDLRRTMATRMGELEVKPIVISKILNHTESGVTEKHYNIYEYAKEKRKAMEEWASYVQKLVVK